MFRICVRLYEMRFFRVSDDKMTNNYGHLKILQKDSIFAVPNWDVCDIPVWRCTWKKAENNNANEEKRPNAIMQKKKVCVRENK